MRYKLSICSLLPGFIVLVAIVLFPQPGNSATAESSHDVVIVGSSLAGLTATFYLDGFDVVLLEKESVAGGRANSGLYPYFNANNSSNFPQLPSGVLLDMLPRLNLSPKPLAEPIFAYTDDGNIYLGNEGLQSLLEKQSSPEDFQNFVTIVNEAYTHYTELPYFTPQSPIAELDTLSVREWFEQNGIAPGIIEYYAGIVRGLSGASMDEVSAISFLRYLGQSLHNFTEVNTDAAEPGYFTLPGGAEDIANALTSHIGPKLHLNATVNSITKDGDEFLVEYSDAAQSSHTIACSAVILAVPAKINTYLAPTLLNTEQMDAFSSVLYTSFATVEVTTSVPAMAESIKEIMPPGNFFTHLINLYRFTEHPLLGEPFDSLAVVSPQDLDDTTLTNSTDEQLTASVLQSMEAQNSLIQGHVMSTEVQRFDYVLPVFTKGMYSRISTALNQSPAGLLYANDYVIDPSLEGALDAGYLAAQQAKGLLNQSCLHFYPFLP